MAKDNYEKTHSSKCGEWLEIEGQEVCGECGELSQYFLYFLLLSCS
jgi:hypothetical protein